MTIEQEITLSEMRLSEVLKTIEIKVKHGDIDGILSCVEALKSAKDRLKRAEEIKKTPFEFFLANNTKEAGEKMTQRSEQLTEEKITRP